MNGAGPATGVRSRDRSRRPAAARLVALALAVSASASGCSAPDADDGQVVADWIAEREHVISADAWVSEDPWSPGVTVTVRVDSAIDDSDLVQLAGAAEERTRDAGWEHPTLVYDLGDRRGFSNLGGRVTLDVFLGLRQESRYLSLSARGPEQCGGIFCVTVADESPEGLLSEVKGLLALADRAGGVQSNLTFTAQNADGRFSVSAEPEAPIDEAVGFWSRVSARAPVLEASAWSIQPVGDLPPLQQLDLVVADDATKLAVERYAATQSLVDITVTTAAPAP
jgi:hypothetical protein